MALPKIEEARALSDEELQEAIVSTKAELFNLRFQKATRQLETTHEFKHKKHRLAQLMTVEGERTKAATPEGSEKVEAVPSDAANETGEGGDE